MISSSARHQDWDSLSRLGTRWRYFTHTHRRTHTHTRVHRRYYGNITFGNVAKGNPKVIRFVYISTFGGFWLFLLGFFIVSNAICWYYWIYNRIHQINRNIYIIWTTQVRQIYKFIIVLQNFRLFIYNVTSNCKSNYDDSFLNCS